MGRYESYTGYKDFSTFNHEQAMAFKKHLASQKNQRTGDASRVYKGVSTPPSLPEQNKPPSFYPAMLESTRIKEAKKSVSRI